MTVVCVTFVWSGPPGGFFPCARCQRPPWTHDYELRFPDQPWRWPPNVIDEWEATGKIDDDRARRLRGLPHPQHLKGGL